MWREGGTVGVVIVVIRLPPKGIYKGAHVEDRIMPVFEQSIMGF